ncbi:MAG: hypothetical protein LBM98_01815 [Oscillospiraceae bacterium]|jgi:amino acid transporter|nr:hypothetical protein [Oscillospiraceae bacterium]
MLSNILKYGFISLYIIGCLITSALVFIYFYPSDYQESWAMLSPAESAAFCLAVGFAPMLAVSLRFYSLTAKKEAEKLKRRLLFALIMLPAAICAVPFVAIVVVFVAAFVEISVAQ